MPSWPPPARRWLPLDAHRRPPSRPVRGAKRNREFYGAVGPLAARNPFLPLPESAGDFEVGPAERFLDFMPGGGWESRVELHWEGFDAAGIMFSKAPRERGFECLEDCCGD